ncbi:hypothetical protein G4B88_028574, partial [Cannabis sativa]
MVEMNNNNYKYEFIEEMDPYYDGKTFLPSDSDDDSEDEAGWLTVINQLKLTDGFQVDHLPNSKAIWSWLVVESFYKTYDKHTIEAAHAAVTEFNKLKDKQLEIKGDLSSRSDVEEVETLTALYSLGKVDLAS